ncbi:MAG: dihydropteroate synthase [Candidatus Binatota bacterium]|jgi:dihydropteroate synthase|nr:dihydropteroate synthase [Candidatus Binatota bacterium]
MGVLNVTPDSFSDGGRYADPGRAVERARQMADEGADLIDVGGESTRPGAPRVSLAEELRRVLPVIRAVRAELRLPISVDTTKAEVAARAIEAGAELVNDVSAGLGDREMLPLVARTGKAIVLMHRRGTPRTMQRLARYGDVVRDVKRHLERRVTAALTAGISRDAIAIDPGIGFAKNLRHNLTLLAHLDELATLGVPIVVGVSRKSFLGRLLGVPLEERVEATVAASLLAVQNGASIVRVHDVAPFARALRVAGAIWAAR